MEDCIGAKNVNTLIQIDKIAHKSRREITQRGRPPLLTDKQRDSVARLAMVIRIQSVGNLEESKYVFFTGFSSLDEKLICNIGKMFG